MQSPTRQQPTRAKPLDACVICLEPISERAVAVPCNHCAFDFLCIATWLQTNSTCPLCKADLVAIQYDWRSPTDFKTYHVPPPATTEPAQTPPPPSHHVRRPRAAARRPLRYQPYQRGAIEAQNSRPARLEQAISRRRYVYRHQLYSLHVGSNRISCFKEFAPQSFSRSKELQSRARAWIRRELQVFDFLSSGPESNTGQRQSHVRRATNAEFILDYIMAILKTVDIKASSGKAQDMLKDFLPDDAAPLFLHELSAWLRSPYTNLDDWDRHVQYRVTLPGMQHQYQGESQDSQIGSSTVESDLEHFRIQGMQARSRFEAD